MIFAFLAAGAALAAFLPLAHAAGGLHGLPVPFLVAGQLGVAAIASFLAEGRLSARPAGPAGASLALLGVACVAAVSLATVGWAAFLAGAFALAVAAGLVAAALVHAAPSPQASLRHVACGALGAAVSAWLSVHVGAPWFGMHGLGWIAGAVCLVAAIIARTSCDALPRVAAPTGAQSIRAAAIGSAVSIACVAWTRALSATLSPTPTVFAACVAAPLAALAIGVAVGVWLSRHAWASRVAVPALLLAAVAAAHPVPPVTPAGAVAMAFGGANTLSYAVGVLVDVLVALAPLSVLAGIAGAILAAPRPAAMFAGGAIGVGACVVLLPSLGAVPGATFLAVGVLLVTAISSAPRRPALHVAAWAAVAVVSVFAWRQGPLPARRGVYPGVVLAARWDADGLRATVQRSDGSLLRVVDSVVVSGEGREWHSARVAAHLASFFAPEAHVALLAGPGRDEARQALLTHGALSLQESDGIRPSTSREGAYDLILHRPPILATWGAGAEYGREAYEAARSALAERGVFVQEVSLRTTPLEHLKRVLAGFVRAFPEGSLWFARESLVLAGGRGPVRVVLSAITEGLAVPPVYADLASMGICRPWDILGMYLCDAGTIAARVAGVRPLSDDEPSELLDPDPRFPFSYVDGLSWLLEGRQGVGGTVIAGASRGERWLIACRLERLRKGSGLALTARLRYEQTFRAKDNQEASDLTTEALNAATQALKIDPGDRYAWETLAAAAKRFGQTADQHAKAPPDPPAEPPSAAVWRFQARPHEQEIMSLLDRLDTERGAARLEALLAIESFRNATVAPFVAELATDPDPFFRASVAGTIERLGNPSGAPAMVKLLSDTEWNVRRAAAQALGVVGGRGEVPALLGALDDEDALVRETVYRSIASIVKEPLPTFEARASEERRKAQAAELRAWWKGR